MISLRGILPVLALFILWSGCKSARPGTVVARVGDSVLTLEEVRADLDTTREDYEQYLEQYVTAWVNSELVYQEAVRLGIDEDPEYLSRLKKVRRQIANQVLLDWLIYRDTTGFPDDTLRATFEADRDEYAITEDHLKLNLVTFGSRDAARRFSRAVNQTKSWDTVFDSVMADPGSAVEVVGSVRRTWFTPSTLFPPELWKLADPLGKGEISFPFKTEGGYTVLQRLAFAPAGRATDFDLVRDEVLNRMLISQRRVLLDHLLGTLRERYNVEIVLNTSSDQNDQDTARP